MHAETKNLIHPSEARIVKYKLKISQVALRTSSALNFLTENSKRAGFLK